MVQSKRGVMLRPFAERRGWSWRASYRDVETLRGAGVPIEHEHNRYRVTESWIPPGAVDVRRDELLALFLARRLAPGLKDTSFGRALDGLWSKLATPTRQTSLPLGDETSLDVPALAPIELGPHRAVIDAAREAIGACRALRVCYRRTDGTETQRVIEPSFLHWSPATEALYLRAFCRERQAFRLFAVHRITSLDLLDDPFVRRPDPEWEPARAFRLWHGATVEHVTVRFSPHVAGEIRERRWHASQHLTEAADGGVVLELDVAAPEELERWLLGYGPHAEVQAPAALAERIRSLHAEAAGHRAGPLRAAPMRAARGASARRLAREGT
jgi:predicted DNA-binding transcriptional regulator YafY